MKEQQGKTQILEHPNSRFKIQILNLQNNLEVQFTTGAIKES